jgi:hypothetical protein
MEEKRQKGECKSERGIGANNTSQPQQITRASHTSQPHKPQPLKESAWYREGEIVGGREYTVRSEGKLLDDN